MKILLVDSDAETIATLLPAFQNLPETEVEVRAAPSGELALEYAAELGHVDWLVTEVFLEPMNGFTLHKKMVNRDLGVNTIFISAYDLGSYAEYTEGCAVLSKPVKLPELLGLLGTERQPETPETAATEGEGEKLNGSPAAPEAAPVVRATPTSAVPRFVAATPSAPGAALPVASAAATASPVAAVPKAVGAARAAPKADPSPAAASGTPRAVPVAPPAGMPTAKPGAVPVARPPAVAVPVAAPAASTETDPLIGQTIGTYKIVRVIAEGKWGPTYEAIQTTMNRPVAMKILAPELEKNPEMKKQFIANASAKANVQHRLILSLYEAGEASGHCYYTHEFVEGANFGELIAQATPIDEPTALQAVKVVSEALAYLSQNELPHSELTASDIYLGRDKRPRLGNIATHFDEHPEIQNEMHTLSEVVSAALPGGDATDPGLNAMLMRMRKPDQSGFQSWPALLQTVKTLEPKVVPADVYKISAQDEAAIRAVENAKKRQKRQILFSLLGAVALTMATGYSIWAAFLKSNEKNLEIMVEIPAGGFIYQNGEKKTLPAFQMGKYEVTIGQYAKFLEDLQKHPTAEFDHPKQPPGKSHIPSEKAGWEIYYGRAKWGKPARFVPIDLNCPIFNVDYWDAYAYAKWRGARLPTEEEWEKAARGTDGRLYPWGNEMDPKKANGKADYIATPGPNSKATVDGYFWWSPVDAITTDKSPYGVIGMAGNLSEWTDSWATDRNPVIRGGNFRNDDFKVTRRVVQAESDTLTESLGFRIASDKPLPKK